MTLIVYSSTYMSTKNLSEEVKARIDGLKYYQAEHGKLEEKFQEEMMTLENKYLELYRPLYEIRSKIVRGEREPTKKEIQAGAKLDEEEQEVIRVRGINEKEEKIKGIPEFWLTALKNLFPAIT